MLPDIKVTDLDLDTVKEYLRVDFTDDDQLISIMIYGAKSFIQNYLNKKFTDWTDASLEIPDEFTIACLVIVAHWYETRQIAPDKNITKLELPYVFSGLLDLHRNYIVETIPADPIIDPVFDEDLPY